MHEMTMVAAVLALALGARESAAQVTTKQGLTLEGARNAIAASVTYARTRGAGTGVIAVVDEGGNLMALERLDGTFAAGAMVSIGKARTAVMFKKPTKFFEDVIKNGRTAMTTLNDFTPLQGGIPIMVDGQVVGGIGVSGAASAQEDEDVAMAGAAGVTDMMTHASLKDGSAVNYFSHEQVAQAFAKGAVLLDGQGRNYMVHASRREKGGMAEVHVLDADVIYVQDGAATFVTGGTVQNPKTVEPNEIRGDSISGGEERKLVKGDVITVPSGTPHWFKDVKGTFTYYVVKVR